LRCWFSSALGRKAGGPDHPGNYHARDSLHATQTSTGTSRVTCPLSLTKKPTYAERLDFQISWPKVRRVLPVPT
jgi:hypothetical protein